MSVQLNHTIIWCHDKNVSASFLVQIFGLEAARPFGPFLVVEVHNGVSLDYHEIDGDIAAQHYAFLVDDESFDSAFERIRDSGCDYWADPARTRPFEINHHDGGKGAYFTDPDGHLLEIITRPYGSGD